jgi:aspartate kinase/aspartokinase/homoserine dehydrogenase 1
MNKIVVKFGGSNLKSTKDIPQIIKVVKQYKTPIVVVSAFYGVTDLLSTLIEKTSTDSSEIKEDLDVIFSKYQVVFDTYINQEEQLKELSDLLNLKREQLTRLLEQLSEEEDNTELKNIILSFGERLSSFVISNILLAKQIQAKEALPEYIGLVSNNKIENAIVPLDSNFTKLKEQLSSDICFVVPGFYAISKKGQISLFGRGGSDYTAAIIAYATKAQSVDLWKDVSGFLSADPKIVESPNEIEQLSYLEAAELSYFGASIIHPATIRPLIKANIPLNIFDINTGNPEEKIGTNIGNGCTETSNSLKSITYNTSFVLLRLKGAGVGIKKGILSKLTQAFDNANINIRSVITSQIEIDFLLHQKDLEQAYAIAKSIQDKNFDIEQEQDIALIAAVGQGIKQSPGIAGQVFGALATANINIRHIVFGASEVAIYLIVNKPDLVPAVRAIHKDIFTKN